MRRSGPGWAAVLGVILVLGHGPIQAQETELERLFSEGNVFYQQGKYQDALMQYRAVQERGYESGALYYNMGNCYYKLRDTGHAILYYERAKRFLPNDEDLNDNLALANLEVVDKFEVQPEFLLIRIVRGIMYLLPVSVLFWGLIVTYLCAVGFLIMWVISRNRLPRTVGMRMSIVFGIACIVFASCLFGQLHEQAGVVEAVILDEKVDAMSAPNVEEGIEVFSLHRGTKVRLDQQSGEWVEIILPDRKVGWVKREVLEVI